MMVILDAALLFVVFILYSLVFTVYSLIFIIYENDVAKWLGEEVKLTAEEGLIVLAPHLTSFFVSALALIPGPSKPFGPFVIYILYVALLRITVFLALAIIYSRINPSLLLIVAISSLDPLTICLFMVGAFLPAAITLWSGLSVVVLFTTGAGAWQSLKPWLQARRELRRREEMILTIARNKGRVSLMEVASITGLSPRRVKSVLKSALLSGEISGVLDDEQGTFTYLSPHKIRSIVDSIIRAGEVSVEYLAVEHGLTEREVELLLRQLGRHVR